MTAPHAASGRPVKGAAKRKLDAFPDRIDLRDWYYQPTLGALPDTLVNSGQVPLILDQGQEGACTGFALAAVINYLLAQRGARRVVSPRMLYEMARCYDEWPGEDYEGASARGAIKGWSRHGVCERALWADGLAGRRHLDARIGRAALDHPAGAYYRIKQKEIRDIHAALAEVGMVYCTIMVHDGWDEPGPATVTVQDGARKRRLPVIQRRGRAESGHAIALAGYTRDGFIVQNSWGPNWGAGGFALLPYEDFLLHATDVWVAQLGVPLSVDLWDRLQAADKTAGRFRGGREIPLAEIRPYVIDVGNNGELSQSGKYWTTEQDVARLFHETIPAEAARRGWKKKRVLLYLHGGLNSEADAAKRVIAFRDKFLANEVYPLHLMWETGPLESISARLQDLFSKADERAGSSLKEWVGSARDRLCELTMSPIGTPMWSEMKQNARFASEHKQGKGAVQLMKAQALDALARADPAGRRGWELHVVAHSAGSILFTHAVEHFCALGIELKTVQFLAPAVRVDAFVKHALPAIKAGRCPQPTLYLLSEKQELDDTVGPYRHSLLWLVSNAFENQRGTPILGMKAHVKGQAALRAAFAEIIESSGPVAGAVCSSTTHGGFDNDAATMNAVLKRILGKQPPKPFEARDLAY